MDTYSKRLLSLQASIVHESIDGLIVSNRQNLAYLTGINQSHPQNREAILLLPPLEVCLYHSQFLRPLSISQGVSSKPMDTNHPPQLVFSEFFTRGHRIGIEATDYTVAEADRLKQFLPHHTLVPTQNLVESLRLIKDSTELADLNLAGALTSKLMAYARQIINHSSSSPTPLTELKLSKKIHAYAIKLGADDLAFSSVVAFGSHTSDPHHQPQSVTLKPGVVLLDLGVKYHGYCADMTRTFWIGSKPPTKFLEIKKVVDSAYQSALNLVLAHFPKSEVLTENISSLTSIISDPSSVTASHVDNAARSVIEQNGFGEQFIHSTGHGLGLSIHESPSINSQNQTQLEKGMVITIEPGIYLPRLYGYRHENTILLA